MTQDQSTSVNLDADRIQDTNARDRIRVPSPADAGSDGESASAPAAAPITDAGSAKECCICLEPLSTAGVATLRCRHELCTTCYRQCRIYKLPCPQCRARLLLIDAETDTESEPGDDDTGQRDQAPPTSLVSGYLFTTPPNPVPEPRPPGTLATARLLVAHNELVIDLWPTWLAQKGATSVARRLLGLLLRLVCFGFLHLWPLVVFALAVNGATLTCPDGAVGKCVGWFIGAFVSALFLHDLLMGALTRQQVRVSGGHLRLLAGPLLLPPAHLARMGLPHWGQGLHLLRIQGGQHNAPLQFIDLAPRAPRALHDVYTAALFETAWVRDLVLRHVHGGITAADAALMGVEVVADAPRQSRASPQPAEIASGGADVGAPAPGSADAAATHSEAQGRGSREATERFNQFLRRYMRRQREQQQAQNAADAGEAAQPDAVAPSRWRWFTRLLGRGWHAAPPEGQWGSNEPSRQAGGAQTGRSSAADAVPSAVVPVAV